MSRMRSSWESSGSGMRLAFCWGVTLNLVTLIPAIFFNSASAWKKRSELVVFGEDCFFMSELLGCANLAPVANSCILFIGNNNFEDVPMKYPIFNPDLFLRDLGSKERILRLWLRLCSGLLLRLLRLLRLPLIQDFKSGSVLALITDNLESSCLVEESVTA